MGKIQTTELANKNIGLEITYGGSDAPFGGVDTSAPPAYIDPRCFVGSEGAIIANNKLCSLSLKPLVLPTLWNSVTGVRLIGFGTFYNSIFGQLNYALGYIAASFGSVGVSPTGVNYTFYITSWNPATLAATTDVLPVTLFDALTQPVSASITLPIIASSAASLSTGSGATGSITAVNSGGNVTAATLTGGTGYGIGDAVQMVPSGYIPDDYGWLIVDTVGGGGDILTSHLATNTGFVYTTGPITAGTVEAQSSLSVKIVGPAGTHTYSIGLYAGGLTAITAVKQFVTLINASPDPNAAASASADGLSLVLTALAPGVAGNTITVQDLSTAELVSNPPPYYFPCRVAQNLEGGADATAAPAATVLNPASATSVGGTIYFGNLGPMILKYSGPGLFAISSMYQGVSILKKFAGSLFGVGIVPALGFEVQNQDMILAWTAGEKLDEWSPVDSGGNVTGAGFEQLADIGEYLSGIIISNGTAFILRKQGVSYATATGNATVPFAVSHFGLGEQGEGTQLPALVTQYDSVGAYIGNSDVWQISGAIKAIGDKIKAAIFAQLSRLFQPIPAFQLASGSGSVYIGGTEYPIAVFVLQQTLFIFNTSNGTWMTLSMNGIVSTTSRILCAPVGEINNTISTGRYSQNQVAIAIQQDTAGVAQVPLVYVLDESLKDSTAISNSFKVTFPQEECAFGRDVTIDALYVAVQGTLEADCTLNVYLNGVLYTSYTLLHSAFFNSDGNPIELQLFPNAGGITTGHSPQLTLEVIAPGTQNSQLRFTKITMFGSIDPSQRPV